MAQRRRVKKTTSTRALKARVERARLHALESALIARANFAVHAGLTYEGERDTYSALGYARKITVDMYRKRYERGGIAERIAEAYARATWSGGATVFEDPAPEVTTPAEEALYSLFDRLDIWNHFLRSDILAGIGRYGVVVIGAQGDLKTPLPKMTSVDDVRYLTTLAEDRAAIYRFVDNVNDPRFGLPDLYRLKLSDRVTREAHWSRVLHIAEGCLEDDVYGKPRLRAVWNYLDDAEKLVGGGSEAAWQRMNPGLHIDIDPEIELDEEGEAQLTEELDELQHNMRRNLRTRGAKVVPLAATVTNFDNNLESVLQLISATTGIPVRILTGSERGELASTQDRNNWNDRIAERRREFAEPLIKRFLKIMVDSGAIPEPATPFQIAWPEADELDEKGKSSVALALSTANDYQARACGEIIMTADEMRSFIFDLPPIAEDAMPDGGELAPEPKVVEVPVGQGDDDEEEEDDEATVEERAAVLADLARVSGEKYPAHGVALRYSKRFERAFREAFAKAKAKVDLRALEEAIARGDRQQVEHVLSVSMIGFADSLDDELPTRLLSVVPR